MRFTENLGFLNPHLCVGEHAVVVSAVVLVAQTEALVGTTVILTCDSQSTTITIHG